MNRPRTWSGLANGNDAGTTAPMPAVIAPAIVLFPVRPAFPFGVPLARASLVHIVALVRPANVERGTTANGCR